MTPVRTLAAAVTLALACAVTACSPEASVTLPPTDAVPDYQLGGAYPPPNGVGIVARDRTSEPAEGVYSICYLNGFQTQPGERGAWPADLILHDGDGPVFDPVWPNEALLDTSTEANRDAILEIVGPWIDGCAASGFDAVEFDNLDTYTRSAGALTRDDNLALATALVAHAHSAGLAAAQKNAAEDAALLHDRAGFDFAVVEECAVFDDCGAYTAVYGDQVIAIEYTDTEVDFAAACAAGILPPSSVLRDRALATPDDPDYAFAHC